MKAHLWAASHLVGGERLARLSSTFVKGRRLPSGEAPKGFVKPLGAKTRLSQLWFFPHIKDLITLLLFGSCKPPIFLKRAKT